ncbi:TonB-dependent siderophore receptor [Plastoroseomonas hellenica]|uniref:TonB-dependent siderophore receptor n=1 Tax=Plastoroseomonas hellenica TaxID=2687306 RepID=UPI001BA5C89F|nr:TonB-dependent siderophore receptor [Plastoroseomonas hellenica]MBR0646129.1 TonB-dependent siderophore receptor [Plastoroseomonas hellenica]
MPRGSSLGGKAGRCALALLAAGAVTPAGGLGAQEAPQGSGTAVLPQIDVTGGAPAFGATRSAAGTKTDTPIVESPQSISVIPRAFIEATGAQSMPEAVRYSAGVTTGVFGFDPRFDQIYIRGFPVNLLGDYRDGLRQAFSAGLLGFRTETYGLDRIVILRGPASVLYGQGPAGGLIDRISRMPSATPSGEVELSLGSHQRYQTSFDLTGPVGDGRVLYRMTGVLRDAESEIPDAPDDRIYLSPAITWRPTDSTTITLYGHYQQDSLIASAAYYTRPDGRPTRVRTDDPSFARFLQNQYQAGYRVEHRATDAITIRQHLRYGQADLQAGYLGGTGTVGNTVSRSATWLEESLQSFGVDTQAELRFATGPLGHTVLAGVEYFRQRSDFNMGVGPAPSLNLANPVYGLAVARPALTASRSRQTLNQLGVYLQDQIRIADRVVVTIGGRHDWTETDTLNRLTGVTTTQDPSAFAGRIGIVYLDPSGLAPYANYSESFSPQLGTDRFGRPFEPLRGRQFEVGLRYQPPGSESLVTASLFHINLENTLTTDPVNRAFSVQTGEQRSRGVELEAQLVLGGGFSMLGSYTFQDVETVASNGADLGKRPVGIPQHVAALWTNWQAPEGRLAGLSLGLGLRYNGSSYRDTANTRENGDSLLVDASIRYDVGPWRATLSGQNLGDTATTNCQPGICYWGPGRTVLASLGYRF